MCKYNKKGKCLCNKIETILEKKCEIIEIKSDEATERDLQNDKIGVLDDIIKATGLTQEEIKQLD
ncbi:MAG: hypothetical protein IKF17_03320 [Clostridia bacterium]|nr:hypothetical protein [Clostridia bacterium]